MTARVPSTDSGRWNTIMANYVAAKEAVDAIGHLADCEDCEATDRIYDLLDEAGERVYSTAAPDLRAVAQKLEVYWGEELFSEEDYVASYKQRIIGDIRRIDLLNAGVDNEDASGGMDLQKIVADWAAALAVYNQRVELFEATPSDRRQLGKASDLVTLKTRLKTSFFHCTLPTCPPSSASSSFFGRTTTASIPRPKAPTSAVSYAIFIASNVSSQADRPASAVELSIRWPRSRRRDHPSGTADVEGEACTARLEHVCGRNS